MKLFQRLWFLWVLILALVVGYVAAGTLKPIADATWLKWCVASITMFCMVWPLEFGALYRAVSRPMGPLVAVGLCYVGVPLLAWPLSRLLGAELGAGLILASAIPTTLTSAAVWTRRAGGDDSVALMVTIITNGICFFATPAIVYLLIGKTIERRILIGTIYKLLWFIVLPMAAGQLARIHAGSANWANCRKGLLSTIAQFGVLLMVLIGAVNIGLKVDESQASGLGWQLILLTVLLVTVIHVVVCGGGMLLARWIGLPRPQQIAVGFSGSQKTLMVGLSAALSMGLNIIPIVAYHAMQLIIDTAIADHLKKRGPA